MSGPVLVAMRLLYEVTDPGALWDAARASYLEAYPAADDAEFAELYGPRTDPRLSSCLQEILDNPVPGCVVSDALATDL